VYFAALKGVRAILSPHGRAEAVLIVGDADRMCVRAGQSEPGTRRLTVG
jgi:hypothetical protein